MPLPARTRSSFAAHRLEFPDRRSALCGQARRLMEQQGGLDHVLLTHRDDVGASAKYAERFGAKLWIHENDREARRKRRISSPATTSRSRYRLDRHSDSGHTIGSVAFLIDDACRRDSLNWLIDEKRSGPIRCAAGTILDMQRRSLKRLQDFASIFCSPPRGSIDLPPDVMQAELARAWKPSKRRPGTAHALPNGVPIPTT